MPIYLGQRVPVLPCSLFSFLTFALWVTWARTFGDCCCSWLKSRRGEELAMPDVLLNTVDMMVKASVPPKGSATAISEMTVAILLGKKPTACREPESSVVSERLIRSRKNPFARTWHEAQPGADSCQSHHAVDGGRPFTPQRPAEDANADGLDHRAQHQRYPCFPRRHVAKEHRQIDAHCKPDQSTVGHPARGCLQDANLQVQGCSRAAVHLPKSGQIPIDAEHLEGS